MDFITEERGYKASRFNMRSRDKHGDLLLLNTYSNKFIRLDEEDSPAVESLLRDPNGALHDHPAFQELYKRGFIVEESVDEFKRAADLHHRTIESEGHLSLILLPNEDCNFRCKYCYESFAKNFMKDWVQDGVIRFLENNLHKYKSLHIAWFGGEPLTAMPIIERLSEQFIKLAKQHRIPYMSSMTTNGYNLTPNVMRKLLKAKVSYFQITLDGVGKTHDTTRVRMDGASTFDRIVRNLRNIRDEVASRSFRILVRGNINRAVLNNIDEYIDFLTEEFSADPRFVTYWQPVGNWGGEEFDDTVLCKDRDILEPMQRAAESGADFLLSNEMMYQGGSVCYAAKRNSFVIGSDGILYKCTVAFDDERNQIGMISEDGRMIIDEERLNLWVTGHEAADSGCQKCFFRPACQGAACPLARMMREGESPCPPVKTHFKQYLQIISNSRLVEKVTIGKAEVAR